MYFRAFGCGSAHSLETLLETIAFGLESAREDSIRDVQADIVSHAVLDPVVVADWNAERPNLSGPAVGPGRDSGAARLPWLECNGTYDILDWSRLVSCWRLSRISGEREICAQNRDAPT